ncbi:mucin-2-like isoform X2 [Gadus chalcogrammus]|uniref:mucin-2-like isoform X2 n=1 Tax=Gadus chalcogrammus TaxID=1042646 RepID=UPI0024C4A995|nr:mucin-2-like isoform X2 [Gadus chalcogrammus]
MMPVQVSFVSGFPFLMGTLHGFVGLFFGLQIVTLAMGFSSGGFVQSCTSLLPDHSDFTPQNSDIPFEVNAIAGEGESIIVSLGIRVSPGPIPPFTGFMVDVRKSEIDPAKGSFVEFGPGSTGLTCNGIQDSAVTQNSNNPKTFVQVKWQAQENGSSSFFVRATFVQDFKTFWSPVIVTIQTPASTTQPPTTTLTSKPSTEQPSTDQPNTEQPTTQQTITEQPTTEQTSTEQPSTEQPSTEQPSTNQQSTEQPTTEQTITEQPTTEQTSTEQPSTEQPSTEQPSTNQQSTEQPTTEQTITEQPTTEQTSTEQPSTEQPSTNQQSTEQPTTEQTITEQPTTEQTSTEQPSTEQPSTEQPSTNQQSTEQPTTEQTITEQPSTEQPSTEQPSTELPSTNQQSTEQPTTEQTITEQPSTEQTSTTNPNPKKLIFALSISSLAPASLNNLTIQTAIEKAIRALINETMGSGDLSYMVLTFKIK